MYTAHIVDAHGLSIIYVMEGSENKQLNIIRLVKNDTSQFLVIYTYIDW